MRDLEWPAWHTPMTATPRTGAGVATLFFAFSCFRLPDFLTDHVLRCLFSVSLLSIQCICFRVFIVCIRAYTYIHNYLFTHIYIDRWVCLSVLFHFLYLWTFSLSNYYCFICQWNPIRIFLALFSGSILGMIYLAFRSICFFLIFFLHLLLLHISDYHATTWPVVAAPSVPDPEHPLLFLLPFRAYLAAIIR